MATVTFFFFVSDKRNV